MSNVRILLEGELAPALREIASHRNVNSLRFSILSRCLRQIRRWRGAPSKARPKVFASSLRSKLRVVAGFSEPGFRQRMPGLYFSILLRPPIRTKPLVAAHADGRGRGARRIAGSLCSCKQTSSGRMIFSLTKRNCAAYSLRLWKHPAVARSW